MAVKLALAKQFYNILYIQRGVSQLIISAPSILPCISPVTFYF